MSFIHSLTFSSYFTFESICTLVILKLKKNIQDSLLLCVFFVIFLSYSITHQNKNPKFFAIDICLLKLRNIPLFLLHCPKKNIKFFSWR